MQEPCPQRIFVDFSFGMALGSVWSTIRMYKKIKRPFRLPVVNQLGYADASILQSPWRLQPGKIVKPWFTNYERRIAPIDRFSNYHPINRWFLTAPLGDGHNQLFRQFFFKLFRRRLYRTMWKWGRWGALYSGGSCAFSSIWGEEGYMRMVNSVLSCSCMGFIWSFKKNPIMRARRKATKLASFILLIEIAVHEIEEIVIHTSRYNTKGSTADYPPGTPTDRPAYILPGQRFNPNPQNEVIIDEGPDDY
eukprot:TRINITY_DN2836_c0_g1_i1.p1 TRINITY_DN2836_c0_g1~~TRINITY_DN2836_c0_g1_i1.p1  ORF type:complete len:249 (+),score=21.19 TRINITY_DN2836_c0_g1_i1:204-950(+)